MTETTEDRHLIAGYGADGAEMLAAAFVQAHWDEFDAWIRAHHGDVSSCRWWVKGRDAVTAELLTEHSRAAVTSAVERAL